MFRGREGWLGGFLEGLFWSWEGFLVESGGGFGRIVLFFRGFV